VIEAGKQYLSRVLTPIQRRPAGLISGVKMTTVLLADDHDLLLNSLGSFLEKAEDIQVVAKTTNGEEAVTQARLYLPDVAVIDISMPILDGIEVTRQIRRYCPSTRVLILSFSDSSANVWHALGAGALGYVLKDVLIRDLLPAIQAISQGNRFFSDKISGIANRYAQNNEPGAEAPSTPVSKPGLPPESQVNEPPSLPENGQGF
jgi:two-component system, NarL family, response regulator LiaR